MEKIDNAIKIFQAYKEGKTLEINWQYNGWQKCFASHDLFYALNENLEIRIAKEPTYRPYANAEEFLKASKEHGGWITTNSKYCTQYQFNPIATYDGNVYWHNPVDKSDESISYGGLFSYYTWADDETPCGILEQ